MNNDARETFNINSQKKSRLCDCSDAYILVNGTIINTESGTDQRSKK